MEKGKAPYKRYARFCAYEGDMKKISILLLLLAMNLISMRPVSASSGWIIYCESAFQGKVIDAETKEPIEGAVVVAIYNVREYGIAESGSSTADAKEVLTDKSGSFYIPPHTFLHIYPFAKGATTTFIVFKAGYASISELNLTDILATDIGKEIESPWIYNQDLKFIFAPRLIGLPRVSNREERLKAIPGSPGFTSSKELPLLYKAINEENKNFGLGKVK